MVAKRVDACRKAKKSWKATRLDSLYYCNELYAVVELPSCNILTLFYIVNKRVVSTILVSPKLIHCVLFSMC